MSKVADWISKQRENKKVLFVRNVKGKNTDGNSRKGSGNVFIADLEQP